MKLKNLLPAVAYSVVTLGLFVIAAIGSIVLWAHWRIYG